LIVASVLVEERPSSGGLSRSARFRERFRWRESGLERIRLPFALTLLETTARQPSGAHRLVAEQITGAGGHQDHRRPLQRRFARSLASCRQSAVTAALEPFVHLGLVLGSMALPWGGEMIFPGYQATMLALEANGVIGLRLIKIALGGVDAAYEVNLMVQEKVDAAHEALATLAGGGSVETVLTGYRRRVAFNAERLAPGSTQ
jgi:hypothetical protein